MRKYLSSYFASLLGFSLLSMPRLHLGASLIPAYRAPRLRTSKTYGAMPVDYREVAAWNSAVVARNRQKGKAHP